MEKYAELARKLWELAGRPKISQLIDATILDPSKPIYASMELIDFVASTGAFCALVPPSHAVHLVDVAKGRGVRLCSVAGFPYGYAPLEAKVKEVEVLARSGVEEVDYVLDVSRIKSGDKGYVEREVKLAVKTARDYGSKVKIIIEAPILTDDEIEWVVDVVTSAGAFMVKTSTGVISKGGDPVTVSRLTRYASKHGIRVKAAGGIRTLIDALEAVVAGASRIGTSSYARIIEEAEKYLG